MASWDYGNFKKYLVKFMSEQDWTALKKEIVEIFSKHNAKRAKLRELIQYNVYRSVTFMVSDILRESFIALDSIFKRLYDEGRRDLIDTITWKDVIGIGILLLFFGTGLLVKFYTPTLVWQWLSYSFGPGRCWWIFY